MAKRYVQSGRPAGLPQDEAREDAERRRRNREMIAGRAPRSKKKQKKLVSRDPRIADSKRERPRSKRYAERFTNGDEDRRQEAKSEWPSGKGQAAIARKVKREKLIRDTTLERGPKWNRPKPGQPNRGAAESVQRVG